LHAVTEKIVTHKLAEYATIYAKHVLSWNEQVNAITTKVNRGLNVLKRLREFVDLETLLTAYKTLVQPYFTIIVHRYGVASAPHFLINCSVYKTELRALSLSVDLMSAPVFFYNT
jgi:hypothetical protein